DHAHLDQRLRQPDRGQPVLGSRIVAGGVQCLRHGGDGHGALALTVDLGKAIAEGGHGAAQVVEIHRAAAVDDGLEVVEVDLSATGRFGHAPHHGGGGKEANLGMTAEQLEDLFGIEAAAAGNDVQGASGYQDRKSVV